MSPQRSFRRFAWIGAASIVVLSLSVLVLALVAIQTRTAMCSFKGDLESREAANQAILDAHPGEAVIDVYGLHVPRSVLENNVRGQRATLDSLESGWPALRC